MLPEGCNKDIYLFTNSDLHHRNITVKANSKAERNISSYNKECV